MSDTYWTLTVESLTSKDFVSFSIPFETLESAILSIKVKIVWVEVQYKGAARLLPYRSRLTIRNGKTMYRYQGERMGLKAWVKEMASKHCAPSKFLSWSSPLGKYGEIKILPELPQITGYEYIVPTASEIAKSLKIPSSFFGGDQMVKFIDYDSHLPQTPLLSTASKELIDSTLDKLKEMAKSESTPMITFDSVIADSVYNDLIKTVPDVTYEVEGLKPPVEKPDHEVCKKCQHEVVMELTPLIAVDEDGNEDIKVVALCPSCGDQNVILENAPLTHVKPVCKYCGEKTETLSETEEKCDPCQLVWTAGDEVPLYLGKVTVVDDPSIVDDFTLKVDNSKCIACHVPLDLSGKMGPVGHFAAPVMVECSKCGVGSAYP